MLTFIVGKKLLWNTWTRDLAIAVLATIPASCVMLQGTSETLPANIDGNGNLFPDGGGPGDGDTPPDGGPDDATGDDDEPMPDIGDPATDDPDTPTDDMTDNADEVPAIAYCAGVSQWSESWSTFEEDVLRLVNQRRATGGDCGSQGSFAPAGALRMNPALRCAARVHSNDMAVRQYFDHINPDGENPGDRLAAAGYSASTWGENIAFGYASPQAVVDGWMASDGHCANMLRSSFTEVGVGYASGNMWTQVFGAP